ncbi:hypothetical protein BDW74DRAFT_175516 [Aspergillus multicolor]|uniref:uncharacterized protein n=1 Tax=Aspergillus multicolor TaxID=41759 RepID=UPI003CCCC557
MSSVKEDRFSQLPTEILESVFDFLAGDNHGESDGTSNPAVDDPDSTLIQGRHQHRHLLRTLAQNPNLANCVNQLILFTNPQPAPDRDGASTALQQYQTPNEISQLCNAAINAAEHNPWVDGGLQDARDAVIDLFDLLLRLPQLKRFRFAPFEITAGVLRLDRANDDAIMRTIPAFEHFSAVVFSFLNPNSGVDIHRRLLKHIEDPHISAPTDQIVNSVLSLPNLHTLRVQMSHHGNVFEDRATASSLLDTPPKLRQPSFFANTTGCLRRVPEILDAAPNLTTLAIQAETSNLHSLVSAIEPVFEELSRALGGHGTTLNHLSL